MDPIQGAFLSIQEHESNPTRDRSRKPHLRSVSLHGCKGIKVGTGEARFDRDPEFGDLHTLALSSGVGILRKIGSNDQFVRVGLVGLEGLVGPPSDTGIGSERPKNLLEVDVPIEDLERATAPHLTWAEVTII